MSRTKNIAKVVKARIENPTDTTREIEDITWIDHTTISRIDKQLQQIATKDDRILWLTDKDFELMKQIQEVKFKRLQEDEQINNNDLDKWENTAVKRYSLFRWSATDKDGGLKWIESIDIL